MFPISHQIWKDAITRSSLVLAGMVAQLWALLEVFGGADAARVPRAIHTTIMRVLRPAEAALRRLIVIEARNLTPEPERPRLPFPQISSRKTPRKPASRMAFQLFDLRKQFRHSVKYTTRTPRIYMISEDARFHRSPIPRSSSRIDRTSQPPLSVSSTRAALCFGSQHSPQRLMICRIRPSAWCAGNTSGKRKSAQDFPHPCAPDGHPAIAKNLLMRSITSSPSVTPMRWVC
jgi:hypothetical protein